MSDHSESMLWLHSRDSFDFLPRDLIFWLYLSSGLIQSHRRMRLWSEKKRTSDCRGSPVCWLRHASTLLRAFSKYSFHIYIQNSLLLLWWKVFFERERTEVMCSLVISDDCPGVEPVYLSSFLHISWGDHSPHSSKADILVSGFKGCLPHCFLVIGPQKETRHLIAD